jgi:phenylalanine-4-hydroxylase
MISQQEVIESLPQHLRPFIAIQDYNSYTPRDQAVWRFLLHQLVSQLQHSAHPLYLQGLERTGITIEQIPKIEVMNAQLQKIGWRATVVDGFIPPAIFIEFLAHKVLVVAVNLRSIENMLYTPAPDIIHESAGHAPFIIDVDYAEYLERVGKFGRRVITHKADMEIYEAIRALSIVKESPLSTQQQIKDAEIKLQQRIQTHKDVPPSEANLLSRLQWWTTEYGLVGDLDDYKIFGAGLLSSLGESVHCLDDTKVQKIPLTIDAVATNYDITRPQPQLFVAKSCRHLSQIAELFAQSTCYAKGGAESLHTAIEAETVNTAVYNSGLEVSGVFSRVITDALGNAIYLNTQGATQLSYQEKELPGHGIEYHSPGFGSPVGKVQAMEKCLSSYSIDDLKLLGIAINKQVTLNFLSGVTVEGMLTDILRQDEKNLIFSFTHCTVTSLDGSILFAPDWGTFDMAVGEQIVSVYGGSADQSTYPLYHKPSDTVTHHVEYDAATQALFNLYQQVRELREDQTMQTNLIQQLVDDYFSLQDPEWLLCFELCELLKQFNLMPERREKLENQLVTMQKQADSQTSQLIEYGLQRLMTDK